MENVPTQHTQIDSVQTSSATHKGNTSQHVKAQVTMALGALDTLYKENIKAYAQELHSYTQKIENAHTQLVLLHKEKEPHTNTLLSLEKEVDFALRLLKRLTEEWCQKSVVISELENELTHLEHTSKERKKILKNRNETLMKLHIEIENTELILLEHELQKQNILLLLEPIERKITTLEQFIKELESEKHYIETYRLHQLSPTIQNSKQTLIS
jgi:chromosome segregation ATPase